MSLSQVFGPIYGDAIIPYALIGVYGRSIDTIIPDCAIEEIHRDEMQITLHPIETGAPVTDHAFIFMATVELRWAWSDSSEQAVGWVQTVYQELLALQQTRQPFSVSTGKRQYTNMLCRSLQVRTDGASEFALMGLAICQQIWIPSSPGAGASNGAQQIGGPASMPIGDGTAIPANGLVYGNQINGIPGTANSVTFAGTSAIVTPAGAVTMPVDTPSLGGQQLIGGGSAPSFGQTQSSLFGSF